jgi:hypothetical protein
MSPHSGVSSALSAALHVATAHLFWHGPPAIRCPAHTDQGAFGPGMHDGATYFHALKGHLT